MLFYHKYNMLCHMAVPPDYRRMGIATQMSCRYSDFREDDEGRVLRALYKSLGFELGPENHAKHQKVPSSMPDCHPAHISFYITQPAPL